MKTSDCDRVRYNLGMGLKYFSNCCKLVETSSGESQAYAGWARQSRNTAAGAGLRFANPAYIEYSLLRIMGIVLTRLSGMGARAIFLAHHMLRPPITHFSIRL